MRFLVDECTGPAVARWLRSRGFEVFSVYDQARGLDDEAVLQKAFAEGWLLLTNDADFGTKVFRERRPHRGVIFLRLADERNANKIEILRLLLDEHSDRLADRFVVVTEKQVRFARD
jgi:predicted nuclease of predicted toxin-antitoxin system